jgi:hypothetical protein
MKTILVRGTMNAGKTLTAEMVYLQLVKSASAKFLFNNDNKPILNLEYRKNGDVYDFKAVLEVNGVVVVIISAGDEVPRLLKDIQFFIDFVTNTLKTVVHTLICCGRSVNRSGSVFFRLQEQYPSSKITNISTEWANDKNLRKQAKMKTANHIISLI